MAGSIFTDADKADTQALLKTGFDDLWCNYLMLRIVEAKPARQWLRGQFAEIKSYAQVGGAQHASHVRQMALTAAGLHKLGLDPALIAQFAPEFIVGLADDSSRSRRLGDIGRNDPSKWIWGAGAKEPHVVLMVFDEDDVQLKSVTDQLLAEAKASGLSEVIVLDSGDMGDREPFGFRDGLSQPAIDWQAERTPGDAADMDFHNLITLGEFLLGYRNEYGLYTERPLLEPQAPGADALPVAEDQPELRDLGRNGSYLVFRQLDQNVRRFWSWMQETAGEADAVALAEAMVGRLYDTGEPLAELSTLDIPGIKDRAINGFNFRSDPDGHRCPIGAHIRRSNPRTGDYPTGRTGIIKKLLSLFGLIGTPEDDRIASTRFHRILRRGREYGEPLDRLEAVKPGAKDVRSGLHFICLNANLSRQFEFVQGAWLANAKFAGMSDEQDPLLGNREPFPGTQANDRFTRPHADGPCRVSNAVPQFIAVRGGAYFFLPGLRALNWLLAER